MAYDGCWAMGVFAVTDFFRIAALLERHLGLPEQYVVEVVSADGSEVLAAGGHSIRVQATVAADCSHDLLVIPPVEGPRLAAGFTPEPEVLAWLSANLRNGARLLAMTTGVCFVAALRLGEQQALATHWAYVRELKKRYPDCQFIPQQSYLQAEAIWSTGTLNGGFDALLAILAHDCGDRFSQLCATHLLVSAPERRAPILPGRRNHCDEAILRLQDWIEVHYVEQLSISRMGAEAGLTERTLKRRFQQATGLSPTVYVQRVRIDKAKKLLLATGMSVKAIAYEVGYENVSFFVRLFKIHAGATPAGWRACEPAFWPERGFLALLSAALLRLGRAEHQASLFNMPGRECIATGSSHSLLSLSLCRPEKAIHCTVLWLCQCGPWCGSSFAACAHAKVRCQSSLKCIFISHTTA
ncbi:GlxA family transcriptional regulator [Pseudomonas juntendi]|uniref:GlxA family transcriptional regulator n=1 Tax=Pseudomonas juntendi TaxID=2666183 RepID=UPI001E3DA5B1|nr:helix-turn-helix domain-containing protein [Pseudomonas juntendi]